jgi:hypothetical protein
MLLTDRARRSLRQGTRVLRACAFAVILFCMAAAVPRAEAASPQTIADVQCMIVGARLLESADQRQRMSGEMLLTYFFGAHRRSVSECRSGSAHEAGRQDE